MPQTSKRSAASVTGSANNVFLRARLKLTGIYVLILTIIVVGYSVFLYQNFNRSLVESSEDDFADATSQQHFIQTTLASVEGRIVLADLVIILLATGVSYVLAGYTLRPIQRSVEAQRAFAENASHELRTPLAVMRNDIEVLMRNRHSTADAVHSTLKSALEEIQGMSKMTEDLLVLARLGNHVGETENIDLIGFMEKFAVKMKPLAGAKNIALSFISDIPKDTPISVRGRAKDIERVLSNLVQNSLEHTPAGGTITLMISKEGSRAIIQVSDTGSGIAGKDITHIFERFYKGDSSSGTGLGLSIAKEIVEKHGGEISLESVKEKGTIATVRLPLA